MTESNPQQLSTRYGLNPTIQVLEAKLASPGGVESLVPQPVATTHQSLSGSMVRLLVGADLRQTSQ